MFLFIVQITVNAFADCKTDSLIHIIHGYERQTHFESDTNYINELINISEVLKFSSPDSSLLFGSKAYELSTKYGYSKSILESAFAMTSIYARQENDQKLQQIGDEVLPIAEKTNRKSLSQVYNIFANAYFYKGYSDKTYMYQAKEMAQKALDICEEYNDTIMMIRILTNISAVYAELYDYSSTIDCLYRAIGLAERLGTKTATNMSLMFHNVAFTYYEQRKFDQAFIEVQKGLVQAEKDNDITSTGLCLQLTGLIYKEQNKLDEALECINRSIEILQRLNLTELFLEAKHTLSVIYREKGLFSEALKITHEVMKAWEEANKNKKTLTIKVSIAEIYLDMKQYHQGLKICTEILEAETDNLHVLNNAHRLMSMMYEAQNNGLKALEHYKHHKLYSDSLFHNNLDEQVINLEAQNKYEKKEMELKAEQTLKEAGYIKDKARLQLIDRKSTRLNSSH